MRSSVGSAFSGSFGCDTVPLPHVSGTLLPSRCRPTRQFVQKTRRRSWHLTVRIRERPSASQGVGQQHTVSGAAVRLGSSRLEHVGVVHEFVMHASAADIDSKMEFVISVRSARRQASSHHLRLGRLKPHATA